MNKLINGVCASVLFALSFGVSAEPYVTFLLGASDIESDVDTISAPPSPGTIIVPEVSAFTASGGDTFLALGGGFIINENLAFEFLLNQYGKVEDTANNGIDFDTKVRSFSVGVVGKWPVADNFSLYAKTGIDAWSADFGFKGAWDYDNNAGTADSIQRVTDSDRGYSLFLGLGADYKITDKLAGFVEYGFHPYGAEYKYYVTEGAIGDPEDDDYVPDKSRYESADIDLTVTTLSLGINWVF